MTPILLTRRYTETDQKRFAQLSGDHNPMHMDALFARRTLFGEPVVHGVHLALSALEAWLARHPTSGIASIKAQFPKPTAVGDEVAFSHNEPDEIIATVGEEIVLVLSVTPGERPPASKPLPALPPEPLLEPTFEQLAGRQGSLAPGLDSTLARQLFPHAFAALGATALSEVLALTRLIGMRCPGLHSIFSQFDVTLAASDAQSLQYRVTKTDERFSVVTLRVEGAALSGSLRAFFRPPPVAQATTHDLMQRVAPDQFRDRTALIIGGTRGLGEVTAKLIAAGGGLPIITYHRGKDDAQRIVRDITDSGKRCHIARLDINEPQAVLATLFATHAPTSLYYFATPKIFGRRRRFFNYDALAEFQDYYVTSFGQLLDCASQLTKQKLRVFYPSSVALDEDLRDMAEYAMAKRNGEALCDFYNRHATNIAITSHRLPRIATDQTMTLNHYPAEDATTVMLPLICALEKASEENR